MLDIQFIEENKEIVAKAIKDKKGEDVDLDKLIRLSEERKKLRGQVGEINAQRNKAAKERDIEAGKKLKEESSALEEKLKALEKEFVALMIQIPNVPSPDTPIGSDESGNKVVKQVGKKPEFSFEPLAHWDLAEKLDLIDKETAAEVTGARFSYLKGDLVMLQFALIDLVLKTLTDKAKLEKIAHDAGVSVTVTPFTPVLPPVMVKPAVLNRMSRLEPREDRYYIESDDLFLAGSSEHTLGPMFMDHLFDEQELPLRFVGYSTCFRREAGTYGKDTKGILRQHQFDKLEMETFVVPEQSLSEQNFLVAIQEHILSVLGLPYQVVMICTGDMGFPDHRQVDIETWMPGQQAYRETHTSDLIAGFQPRRLNTRVKRTEGKSEHVHMNDATILAIGRALIAIMENYQRRDGAIDVPEVLRPYMGKSVIGNVSEKAA